tara:strand:+ start:290 stop:628 length:339 start_codon:yes stop_codon:yes gene_type:complete
LEQSFLNSLKNKNMQTNLKEALKSADTIKSPLGDISCYAFNFAELAAEVEVHLNPEGTKVKFTWREYVQLAQIIWNKIKETSKECAGKEIEVKVPAKFGLISAAFALIGFKL